MLQEKHCSFQYLTVDAVGSVTGRHPARENPLPLIPKILFRKKMEKKREGTG